MNLSKKQRIIGLCFRFFAIFVSSCFLLSVSFKVFLKSAPMDIEIVRSNAVLTFVNMLVLCLLFSAFEFTYRYFTIERPVKRITDGLKKIMQGDFSVRLKPVAFPFGLNEFNPIIEQINVMTQSLGSVEILQNDFISNVSHELKTPLSVIGNYATLLKNPLLTEVERNTAADLIFTTVTKLATLVTDILRLNKLENQKISPAKKAL